MIIFKDENRKRLVVSVICLTFLVLCLVSSGTYAFLSWVTVEEDATTVIFDIEGSGMNASLSGGVQTVNKLLPAECTNEKYAIKKEIILTYENKTDSDAIIKVSLSIQDFVSPYGTLTKEDLSHFHYALTMSPDSCSSELVVGTSGSFSSTEGFLFSNIILKKNIVAGTNTTVQRYYLWVWLDKEYQHINIGDNFTDPIQDLSFKLVWSGSISYEHNGNAYAIYSEDDNSLRFYKNMDTVE